MKVGNLNKASIKLITTRNRCLDPKLTWYIPVKCLLYFRKSITDEEGTEELENLL